MPGPDAINKRREEILRNLSPEEVETMKEIYNLKDKNDNAKVLDGLVAIEPPGCHVPEWLMHEHMGVNPIEAIKVLGMGHRANKAYSLAHIKAEDIPTGKLQSGLHYIPLEGKPINSLTEEHKLHMLDSQYTAAWMYSTLMFGNHFNDLVDQIGPNHEQYEYFFNSHRENVRLPRIELVVGELYELRLGRSRDIIKNMILVKMDNFSSNTLPELYFENENTVGDSSRSIKGMNVSHTKVWGKVKND